MLFRSDINLYSGTSGSQTITNTQGFQPSFIWLKSRSTATNNIVHDVLRGTAGLYRLFTDSTTTEGTTGDGFASINSNGFSLDSSGGGGDVNTTGRTYVAWQWGGPSSGSTNNNGSITSSVAVNTSSGFSVVTYTGNGSSSQTVGHGLGVVPSMIITKGRSGGAGGTNWMVYHKYLNSGTNAAQYYLNLNNTNAQGGASNVWQDTAPTS